MTSEAAGTADPTPVPARSTVPCAPRRNSCVRWWEGCGHGNTASHRVLAELGFTETDRREEDATHGTTLVAVRRL